MDEIKTVVVSKDYLAWGEFADLIANNDEKLVDLAGLVMRSKGEDLEEARKQMLAYIKSSASRGRNDFTFGNIGEIKYRWHNGLDGIDALAARLYSAKGPGKVSGTEYYEYDMETGKYSQSAYFDLS